jgi:hypothetical protein
MALGTGYLAVQTTTANGGVIVGNASVTIANEKDEKLYELITNETGHAPEAALEAPDEWLTEDPEAPDLRYSMYKVTVSAPGYDTMDYDGVMIFDTVTSMLQVDMEPSAAGEEENTRHIYVGGHKLDLPVAVPQQAEPQESGPLPRVLPEVTIPNFIRVHLGRMEVPSQIVRIPFIEYIKNVTSHEIFDTWPEEALTANIHCIISFTLNRVFTDAHR